MQVAMNSVYKYYLDKDFPLDVLDVQTHRGPSQWTTTYQIVLPLWNAGLDLKYYTSEDPVPIMEGEPFYRRYFGDQAEYILSKVNVETIVESIKELLKYNLTETRILTFTELESHIQNNHVLLVTLDWAIVKGKRGPYTGHFVPLVGFDDENFYVHDSGPDDPTAYLPIPKSIFKRAWDAKGADNDAIVILGKRK